VLGTLALILGAGIVKMLFEGVADGVRVAQLPAYWTPQTLDSMASLYFPQKGLEAKLGFSLTEDDVREIKKCTETGITREFPGGPRQALAMDTLKQMDIGQRIGHACGTAFSQRLLATCSERGAIFFTTQCTQNLAKDVLPFDAKTACSCLAKNAPRHYATPMEFVVAERTLEAQQSKADRRKMASILGACLGRKR